MAELSNHTAFWKGEKINSGKTQHHLCQFFPHLAFWTSKQNNSYLSQLTLLLVEQYVSMAIVFILRLLFCDYIIIKTVPLSCAWILRIWRVVACSRTWTRHPLHIMQRNNTLHLNIILTKDKFWAFTIHTYIHTHTHTHKTTYMSTCMKLV